jgi:hypothetical protein
MGEKRFVVRRQRRMEAPLPAVRERIVDFRRWQAWSPWEGLDPGLQRSYSGSPAGVGAVYEWRGNRRAGTGRMEIKRVTDTSVTIDLQFLKPFRSRNTTVFRLEPEGECTAVTWTTEGPVTLMSRVMGIFVSMDKMLGPDLEKGLARLEADAATH